MARGKHERIGKHRGMKSKTVSLLLSIALLLTFVVGGTLAYIASSTDEAKNQFTAGRVTSAVNEDGTVTNTGNVDAYIRAAVVVNWVDDAGNVYGIRPSYTVSVNNGWVQIGDFYYYTSAVAPEAQTATSPVTVFVNSTPPSDAYSLCIEEAAEAIQAEGDTDTGNVPAYKDAWGISSISGS